MARKIKAASDLRIMNVAGEWEKMRKALAKAAEGEAVPVSFADTQNLDGAGMQLFLYIQRHPNTVVEGVTEKISGMLKQFGFESISGEGEK